MTERPHAPTPDEESGATPAGRAPGADAIERDRLSADEIRRDLRTAWCGQRVFVLTVTASTSDVAWRLAEAGLPNGTVVFAEQQVRGRGSRGRTWHSVRGLDLLFSLVLRVPLEGPRVAALTTTIALGLARAIEEITGIRASIRWPNDLLVGHRKIGGILVESRTPSPSGPTWVVGVGLNVHESEDDFPVDLRDRADSLDHASHEFHPRIPLARAILERLEESLDALTQGEVEGLEADLSERSWLLGRRVALDIDGTPWEGWVDSVDLRGALTLRSEDGSITRPPAERVRLRYAWDDDTAIPVRPDGGDLNGRR